VTPSYSALETPAKFGGRCRSGRRLASVMQFRPVASIVERRLAELFPAKVGVEARPFSSSSNFATASLTSESPNASQTSLATLMRGRLLAG
jgi:hypothetical protein